MMPTLKEDLQLALDVLKKSVPYSGCELSYHQKDKTIAALETRLANWKDEPVAWKNVDEWGYSTIQNVKGPLDDAVPLYLHPAEPVIPKGWKLVPIEPTPDMQRALNGYSFNTSEPSAMKKMACKAIINAAPDPGR